MKTRARNLQDNGPPPEAAATLYAGQVMHHRLKPFGHRFTYGVTSLVIDIDRLEEAGRLSPLFGVNRAAPVSFHASDHLREGTPRIRDRSCRRDETNHRVLIEKEVVDSSGDVAVVPNEGLARLILRDVRP